MTYLNDADIEQHQLNATAERLYRLEKSGICTHGHHQVQDDELVICLRCGQVFADEDAAFQAHQQYL